jgi:hypothetical protein
MNIIVESGQMGRTTFSRYPQRYCESYNNKCSPPTVANPGDSGGYRALRGSAIAAVLVLSTCFVDIGSANAQNANANLNFNVNIDPLAIGNAIAGAVRNNENREACIADLANATDYATHYKSNILVVNLAEHPYVQSSNIVFYGSATCADARVGVWAFGDGHFTREGDGGYINWYLIGNFNREGDQGRNVTFYPR